MREAKFAASVFGAVTVCLFGGLAVAYKAAPDVSSSNNNLEIVSSDEEMTTAATETSVSTTTAITTTSITTSAKKSSTTTTVTTTAADYDIEYTTAAEDTTAAEADTTAEPETAADADDENVEGNLSFTYESYQSYEAEPETEPETYYTEPETEAPTEPETEAPTEPETEAPTEAAEPVVSDGSLPISESDFILLCNVVGHEAGSNWIGLYDKAYVVEVIMNRVYSPLFPNSISEVLTQPYQFTGSQSYAFLGTYSGYVTEQVKDAVRLYFNEPGSFSQGYLYFWGDGYQNHFS